MARNGILLAVLLLVAALTGGCSLRGIVNFGQDSDAGKDQPVIKQVPNICKLLTGNPETSAIVGNRFPPHTNDEDPIGWHRCVFPAVTTPIRAEVRVTVAPAEERAEASAREAFSEYVRTHNTKDRSLGLVRYGDYSCVQAWNPPDVLHSGIMKEGNVLTVITIQTREKLPPQRLRAVAGDVRGPLRTLLRVIDGAIARPHTVFRDPSGDIPKPPTPEQRDAQPDWNDRRCKEKLAPPVFNL